MLFSFIMNLCWSLIMGALGFLCIFYGLGLVIGAFAWLFSMV